MKRSMRGRVREALATTLVDLVVVVGVDLDGDGNVNLAVQALTGCYAVSDNA